MTGDLVVDSWALEHAALTLRHARARLMAIPVEHALADTPGALPVTDTGAACAEVGRRLGAGVLAFAESVGVTAGAVLDAAAAYTTADAGLAVRAAEAA
ncbi:MAG: hypothetical protein ACR2FG_13925 [Marmoricola sp.]